jgi:hypothetical protein
MLKRAMNTRAAAAVLLLLTIGCASAGLKLKQQATLGVQSAHTAVATAQDFERGAYDAKTIPSLTPQVHLRFSNLFQKYFHDEQLVDDALIAWRANDPVPQSLTDAMKDLNDALAEANTLTTGAEKDSLAGKINAAIAEVKRIIAIVGGGA